MVEINLLIIYLAVGSTGAVVGVYLDLVAAFNYISCGAEIYLHLYGIKY
jgi:hypothetical protein